MPGTSGSVVREEVRTLVLATISAYAGEARGRPAKVADDTSLIGEGGLFDSMGLVTVVLEVEQRVNERGGPAISLADDRALSRTRSPFRTAGSLIDYVVELLQSQGVPPS